MRGREENKNYGGHPHNTKNQLFDDENTQDSMFNTPISKMPIQKSPDSSNDRSRSKNTPNRRTGRFENDYTFAKKHVSKELGSLSNDHSRDQLVRGGMQRSRSHSHTPK